uniref:PX domain-containing protein n=1 Tax=Lotharella oceanica TaxID=641309 RepID=A0A7S2XF06_9EUKA|mmetsp:Transcript_36032/g.66595  ORF Transcript_36032/g.66595 Transcript_36032/m.66595 type:complete len:294 (+) Transcript_36032:103-984(+)
MSVVMPAAGLRKAKHFDEISEIMGRLALERQKECDVKSMQSEPVATQESKDAAKDNEESVAALREQVRNQKNELTRLKTQLMRAEKAMAEKSAVIKMLEAENKHLSSMVDEGLASQYMKDMYESAPQKRTAKQQQDSKVLRSLNGSIGESNVAPIVVRMPDNPRLGWAVSKSGIVMHRLMIEFSATLNHLDGRKMMLKWSVLRRYSSFEKLIQDLHAAGFRQLPSLPAKSWFRVDPKRRQQQLGTFINQLLVVPGVLSMAPFRKFLNLTTEMASLLPGGSNRTGAKKRVRSRS